MNLHLQHPPLYAPAARRAPDSIMAELWAVKAKMNADAGYDVARLLANVRVLAQQSRQSAAGNKSITVAFN